MKRIKIRAAILGLVTGVVLYEAMLKFHWSILTTTFVGLGVVFLYIVLGLVISGREQGALMMKLNASRALIDKDIDAFLDINEELYDKYHDDTSRLKIISNMIVGYDRVGDYNTPITMLNRLSLARFTKEMKEFVYSTLAMLYFKAGRAHEAIDLMDREHVTFERYKGNAHYMGSIFFYDEIMRDVYLGHSEEAYRKLKRARREMGPNFFTEEFDNLAKTTGNEETETTEKTEHTEHTENNENDEHTKEA